MIPNPRDNEDVPKITDMAGHNEPAEHSLSPRLVTHWLCDLR